jgi:hypothetical protein
MPLVDRAVASRDPLRASSTAARIHRIGGQIALAKRNLPPSLKGCRVFGQCGRLFVRHNGVTFSGRSVAALVERAAHATPDTTSAAAKARAKIERLKHEATAPLRKIAAIKAAAVAELKKSRYR